MLRSAATANRTEVQPSSEMKQITTRRLTTATPDAEPLTCAPVAAQTLGQINDHHSLV
jgi:hypothetical protein